MNTTDYDKEKFSKDSHGNLIPKEVKDDRIHQPRPRNTRYVSSSVPNAQFVPAKEARDNDPAAE